MENLFEIFKTTEKFYWQWIIIHHSATKDGIGNDWESIRKYHTSYRYNGNIITKEEADALEAAGKIGIEAPWVDIGYNFGIEIEGEEYKINYGRPLTIPGAHAGVAGKPNGTMFNNYGIGVCLIGNYDQLAPSGPGLDKLSLLIQTLMWAYDIPAKCVLGHREIYGYYNMEAQKSCPGRNFSLDAFRKVL